MRSDSEHHGALKTRRSQATHITVLHVTDASMHHLEAVRGCPGGEIFTFNQRCVESTQRSLARSGCAGGATPHNEDIEQFAAQPPEIPANGMFLFHQPIIAKFIPGRAVGHAHCCAATWLPSDIRTRAQ